MKLTFQFTIVRSGKATRQVIISCSAEGAQAIVRAHEARGASVTVEQAFWGELDRELRPYNAPGCPICGEI